MWGKRKVLELKARCFNVKKPRQMKLERYTGHSQVQGNVRQEETNSGLIGGNKSNIKVPTFVPTTRKRKWINSRSLSIHGPTVAPTTQVAQI